MAKLSDSELLATIDREERNAYGYTSGDLATERAQAMDYYLGKPFGNEIEGRSQVVSTDVADTIEWVIPSLIKIFASGDKVVEFQPRGVEDIEAAEQETEYVNHLVMEKNPGLEILYTWFKDALIQKVGYVKVWFEEVENTDEEYYEGLSDEEFAMLQSQDVEPIEYEAVQVITEMGPATAHNVRVKKTTKDRKLCIAPVPAEEIRVHSMHRSISLQDTPFVQHYCRKTISDLRAMGYDIKDDFAGDDEDVEMSQESLARDLYGEEAVDDDGDREMRRVWLKDTYIRIDMDGDGIAELRHVVHAGNQVLENEVCDLIPFAAVTPILMPHRHIGRSFADQTMDVQLVKSTLIRQTLDNFYLANNGRTAINEDRVNLEDMLVSRPGGVIRVKGDPGTAFLPVQHPSIGAASFQMIEYMDSVRENRTGVTKYNQGLDADSLNKTASGIQQIMNASQQRIELVARLFAETGVKDLFLIVHAMCRKYSQREEVVRLRGKWVPIDPRQWKRRSDLSISVGLGTGSKDQMLAHIMQILQVQREALQIGVATPKNIYNAVARLTQNAGFKDVEEFWTNPDQAPPQQPQPDPELQKAQIEAEDAEKQRQADIAMKQMEIQMDKYRADLDAQTKLAIAELDRAAKAEIEMFKARVSAQVSRENAFSQREENV